LVAVLTYVRNSFENHASTITPTEANEIRKAIKDQANLYTSAQLLEQHPN